ncbi:MAG: hypothetical protein NC203_05070 [Firmicutes bacterium]|nr:hypothetical protein [[Eubacterium] siraeum]MCM1487722.1 hypothetical protein [Bacillota bacterium]
MTKIKRKSTNTDSKAFIAVFAVIDSLLLIAALALLILGLLFNGSGAPSIFSHRIYLMDSDAFSLVKKGSAVVASEVPYEEILAGNIVIYSDDEDNVLVGEVQSFNFAEGVYTFSVKNDAEMILTVGQSRILGKGIYYSEFLGGLVSFVTSPGGVCLIALLPCAAFIIYDIIKAVRRKIPQPVVTTVKKQDETPTYVPPVKSKPDMLDGRDMEDDPVFAPQREKMVEAAGLSSPYQKKTEYAVNGNYGSYDRTGRAINPSRPQGSVTVSERDIDKLIRETKAEHSRRQFASEQAEQRSKTSQGFSVQRSSDTVQSRSARFNAFDANEEPSRELPRNRNLPQYEPQNEPRPVELPEERPEEQPPVNPLTSKLAQESLSQFEEEINVVNRPREGRAKRPTPRLSPRVSKLDSIFQEEVQSNYNIDEILNRLGGNNK